MLKLNIIPINKVKKRLGTANVLGQMKRIAWPAQQRVHPEIATKKVIYLMFNITVIIVYAYPTKAMLYQHSKFLQLFVQKSYLKSWFSCWWPTICSGVLSLCLHCPLSDYQVINEWASLDYECFHLRLIVLVCIHSSNIMLINSRPSSKEQDNN